MTRPPAPNEEEIEVTAEMLKVGVDAFLAWQDLQIGTAETAAFAIFKAMVSASPTLRKREVIEG
jgi:hypothetical protein